jgi:transcriptional regulator with XRE-family HTH domain
VTRGQDASFGARLRRLREAAGLTQEELAERAGLTARGISDLERGARNHPYPHTVRSLAAALELPEDERSSLFAAVPKRSGGRPSPTVAPGATSPVPLTSLVGRERNLEEIDLLARRGQAAHAHGTWWRRKTRWPSRAHMPETSSRTVRSSPWPLGPRPRGSDRRQVAGVREAEGQTPREALHPT